MTNYTVGGEGGPGSQAVYPVNEVGPGVVVAYAGEHGMPAHLAPEMGPGVQAVYFENGLPGSVPPMHGPLAMSPPQDEGHAEFLLLLA